jgi:hypothetical protein
MRDGSSTCFAFFLCGHSCSHEGAFAQARGQHHGIMSHKRIMHICRCDVDPNNKPSVSTNKCRLSLDMLVGVKPRDTG